MKLVIIEDEDLAAERLMDLLKQHDPTIEVLACLDSVASAVAWFKMKTAVDLVFMDIQLGDGLSFDIFEEVEINCPVIFTTAYDEYALRAFKVNSIDYLLKPLGLAELQAAFQKLSILRGKEKTQNLDLLALQNAMQMMNKEYKSRFIVKAGNHLSSVPTEEIAYFYSEYKAVWIWTYEQKKHSIDYSLEQLETLVSPKKFFRANRKYLIGFRSIVQVTSYSNSRLKLILRGAEKEEILISRERVNAFKLWLDQ
ncbi:MAG: LytR/AlgR family response regulator transcription factor [Saprospiraceae bacterium]